MKGNAAPQTPATAASYNKLKDFSVESQRRMFIQEQERERQAAEFRRSSRKITRASLSGSNSGEPSSSVMMSGLMYNLESGNGAFQPKTQVGDDDDDSIADDLSLDSEESFYVGIERADYTQPNNLEMYGHEKEATEFKEDRLGISRVSAAIVNCEKGSGPYGNEDESSPLFIHDEKSSSLHGFMTGNPSIHSKRDIVVAMPMEVVGIDYRGFKVEDDMSHAQVYQQEAAEGKMFINKIVEASAPNADTSVVNNSTTTPTRQQMKNTPFTTPGAQSIGTNVSVTTGNYPVLSPMALFSPLATGGAAVKGEDNALRQLREREIRKDASVEANAALIEKVKELQKYLANAVGEQNDGDGTVDAAKLTMKLEQIMALDFSG